MGQKLLEIFPGILAVECRRGTAASRPCARPVQ